MKNYNLFFLLLTFMIIPMLIHCDDFGKLFVNTKENIIFDESTSQYESPVIGNNYIDDNMDIFICDFQAKNVKRYDKSGKLKAIYGREGEGPGEFTLPYTVVSIKNKVIVKDLFKDKLIVFDKESGKFIEQKDFLPGCHQIEINRNDQLFCGFTGFKGKEKIYRLNDKFVKDGMFCDIKVFTDIEYKEWPWLPMDFDSKGNIFVGSWLSYKIAMYDKNLKFIKVFGQPSKFWNPPEKENPIVVKDSNPINLEYTKMINVFVLNDRYILTIRTASNNKELWYLDLYNTEGKLLYQDISSTRLIVGRDNLSNIYVNTYEEKSNDIIQKLTKYKLRKIDM